MYTNPDSVFEKNLWNSSNWRNGENRKMRFWKPKHHARCSAQGMMLWESRLYSWLSRLDWLRRERRNKKVQYLDNQLLATTLVSAPCMMRRVAKHFLEIFPKSRNVSMRYLRGSSSTSYSKSRTSWIFPFMKSGTGINIPTRSETIPRMWPFKLEIRFWRCLLLFILKSLIFVEEAWFWWIFDWGGDD